MCNICVCHKQMEQLIVRNVKIVQMVFLMIFIILHHDIARHIFSVN